MDRSYDIKTDVGYITYICQVKTLDTRSYWVSGKLRPNVRTPQVPGPRLGGYGTLSNELLTECHLNSIIIERSLRMWKVEEGFVDRV